MKIPFLSRFLAKAQKSAFADWPVGSLALVSKQCIGPSRKKVRYLKRDEPHFAQDSGWILFSGEESQPLNASDFVPTALRAFVSEDPSLEIPFSSAIGAEWIRRAPEEVWLRIDGEVRTVGEAQ